MYDVAAALQLLHWLANQSGKLESMPRLSSISAVPGQHSVPTVSGKIQSYGQRNEFTVPKVVLKFK